MKKKLLISELNRMREMMDLPIISENKISILLFEGDGTKGLGVLGIGGKSVDNLTKAGIDASMDLSKLSDEFVKLTGKANPTMDDFLKIVSDGLGKNSDELADAEVTAFVKKNTDLYNSILKKASDEATKIVDNLMKNTKISDLFTKAGKEGNNVYNNIKIVIGTPISYRNSDYLLELVDDELKYIDDLIFNLKKEGVTPPDELVEIAQQLVGKKGDIVEFKEVSTSSPNSVNIKVSDEPTGFKGQKEFKDFSRNWTRQDVESKYDPNSRVVIKSSADETFTNLPTQFDPSQVKLGRTNTYEFFDEGQLRERTQIEVTLPNGKKTLIYSSSGANEGTTGKKAGEWFWIPGFAKNGWYIKTGESVAYTKGGNEYMTEFAKFLEKNGYNGLGQKSNNINQPSKIVTPQNVSNNRLTSLIGDTSKIDWSKITNSKNAEDYGKLIDTAIETNDYMKISRFGFEEYGIPNFRTYIMDLDLKGGDVSSDMLQGNSIYQMNRDIYDLYKEEGGPTEGFYSWLETLPKDELYDLEKYIQTKR
jgi:signal peptidase I